MMKRRLRKMSLKNFFKKHLKRGFKFCIVGTIGAIESLTIQYILTDHLKIYHLHAAIIGIGAALLNNYFLNSHFTFKQQTKPEIRYMMDYMMEQAYDL